VSFKKVRFWTRFSAALFVVVIVAHALAANFLIDHLPTSVSKWGSIAIIASITLYTVHILPALFHINSAVFAGQGKFQDRLLTGCFLGIFWLLLVYHLGCVAAGRNIGLTGFLTFWWGVAIIAFFCFRNLRSLIPALRWQEQYARKV
jgi:hypothetical protein